MLSRTKIILVLILSYDWSRLNGLLAILTFVDHSLGSLISFLDSQASFALTTTNTCSLNLQALYSRLTPWGWPDGLEHVYVADIIFWSKDTEDINNSAMQMHELGVNLEQKDNTAGFLGVTLEWDPETGLLKMKQTGLIKWVIKALGLDNGLVKGKYTPSESQPLVKNINGEAASGAFSYSSVVGMFCIYPDTPTLIALFLSIVVLNTCFVLNICMS